MDTEKVSKSKGGSTQEISPVNNRSGWYKFTFPEGHVNEQGEPEAFVRLIAMEHPKFGNAQADAFVRMGYVWDGAATPEDIKKFKPNPIDDRVPTHTSHVQSVEMVPRSEFEALQARLTALEAPKNAPAKNN